VMTKKAQRLQVSPELGSAIQRGHTRGHTIQARAEC
jgi:hypothetical protein